MRHGEIAKNLDRLYEYFQHLLITANVKKIETPIDECIRLMTDMRDMWQEAFRKAAEERPPEAPRINQHGAAVLNLQG